MGFGNSEFCRSTANRKFEDARALFMASSTLSCSTPQRPITSYEPRTRGGARLRPWLGGLASGISRSAGSRAHFFSPTAALWGSQEPLRGDDAQSDGPSPGRASSLTPSPRNATLKLYPGGYGSNKHVACSSSFPAESLSLPPDVCLSGDYYFHTNVELLQAPVCDDGSQPYMAIFNRRGCTGNRTWFDHGRSELPTCLDKTKWPLGSSETAERTWSHWSVMFYCSHLAAAMATDGAKEQRIARPPSVTAATRGPKAGTLRVFETQAKCKSGQSAKDEMFEAPSYLNLAAYIDAGTGYVGVSEPAFCTDGSRAQLALYKDVSCASHHHGGTHDHDAVVLDVRDEDLGQRCVDVAEFVAVAFSCTGEDRLPTAIGFADFDLRGSWWSFALFILLGVSAVCLALALATMGAGEMRRQLVSSRHLAFCELGHGQLTARADPRAAKTWNQSGSRQVEEQDFVTGGRPPTVLQIRGDVRDAVNTTGLAAAGSSNSRWELRRSAKKHHDCQECWWRCDDRQPGCPALLSASLVRSRR